jgi:hypothetical protein
MQVAFFYCFIYCSFLIFLQNLLDCYPSGRRAVARHVHQPPEYLLHPRRKRKEQRRTRCKLKLKYLVIIDGVA